MWAVAHLCQLNRAAWELAARLKLLLSSGSVAILLIAAAISLGSRGFTRIAPPSEISAMLE
jgi:hypothetical protein